MKFDLVIDLRRFGPRFLKIENEGAPCKPQFVTIVQGPKQEPRLLLNRRGYDFITNSTIKIEL
jgi:hypothetical protein